MSRRIVILGRSVAALTALENLRAYDKDSPVVMVDVEAGRPYARTLLSRYAAGEIEEQALYLWGDPCFDERGVMLVSGDGAKAVDPADKRVYLQSGRSLPFDALLIATGATPERPKIPGLEAKRVMTFRTREDAQRLRETFTAKPGGSLAVIGAGLIGVEVAMAGRAMGWHVSLLELQPYLLPRYLDFEAARLLEELLTKKGIEVYCGRGAASISHNTKGEAEEVFLEDGFSLRADLVVLAAGVRPQIDFLRGSGLTLITGLVVNDHLETNYPYIYAAGDCAQGPDLFGGPPQVFPLWPVAQEMGKFAGLNMAGQKERYPGGYHRHVLTVFGQAFASFGQVHLPDDEFIPVTYQDPSRLYYRKILFDGQKLIGAIIVGQVQELGVLNNLIGQEVPLRVEKDLLAQHPLRYGQWLFHAGGVTKISSEG